MPAVDVHRAKAHLSRRPARVEAGEEVVIARRGGPGARLGRCEPRGKATIRRPEGESRRGRRLLRPPPGGRIEAVGRWVVVRVRRLVPAAQVQARGLAVISIGRGFDRYGVRRPW